MYKQGCQAKGVSLLITLTKFYILKIESHTFSTLPTANIHFLTCFYAISYSNSLSLVLSLISYEEKCF